MEFLPKFIDKTLKLIEEERSAEIEEAEKLRVIYGKYVMKRKELVK